MWPQVFHGPEPGDGPHPLVGVVWHEHRWVFIVCGVPRTSTPNVDNSVTGLFR